MVVEIVLSNSEVPIKQPEKLLLHEIDFRQAEAKIVEATNACISSPVLVLWRGIVQVLGSEDQRGEEDAVRCALHSFGDRRQTLLQSTEIDKRGHQRRNLYVRLLNKGVDEELKRR